MNNKLEASCLARIPLASEPNDAGSPGGTIYVCGQMTDYVAFMRAINVAGHARVKMNVLKETFI